MFPRPVDSIVIPTVVVLGDPAEGNPVPAHIAEEENPMLSRADGASFPRIHSGRDDSHIKDMLNVRVILDVNSNEFGRKIGWDLCVGIEADSSK